MSRESGSRAIVVSLVSDLGIAAVKFGAAFYTGSAALMAEAVHSVLDSGNSLLLLYGRKVAVQETPQYPLGRDREQFFWAFMVSLLLFSMGGMFSLYEGVRKWTSAEPVANPLAGMVVLVVAMAAEGYALRTCFKDIRANNPYGSFWQWVKHTAAADLLVATMINLAALLGLLIAFVSLAAAWVTGEPHWDGIGSLLIGLLLVLTALLLARELKSLLIGEATRFDYRQAVTELIESVAPGMRILQFVALRRGFNRVLIAYKLHPGNFSQTQDAIAHTNRLEETVRTKFPEIGWQFVELDTRAERD